MTNLEIAKIFREIAILYEIDEVPFKPRAYERVASSLESLGQNVADIYETGGLKALEKIPGVGKNTALHIEELIKTGRLKLYKELKKSLPIDIDDLTSVLGVGPKTIQILYKKLKIKNVVDLEKAARSGKIAKLAHFGEQSQEKILKGLEFYKKSHGRFLLGHVLPMARDIEERLRKIPGVDKVQTAGSIRRRQETIGDIDTLITAKHPKKVMEIFTRMPEVEEILAEGPTKTTLRLNSGIQADVRILPPEDYGAALQYFTGDKNHNIEVRKIAIKKGLKLNEYGIFRGKKKLGGKTEEEIYKILGMGWMEPELRTASGEIEAALRQAQGKPNGLPKIIGYDDIRGDLHVHTKWSEGLNTIQEMALAGKKLGYEYISISDHVGTLHIANAMDEKKVLRQIKEIDKLNAGFAKKKIGIKILKSAETNISADGDIDLPHKILEKLDIVLAAVHDHFNLSKEKMTARIIRAMKHKNVNVIAHPTGRVILQRPPYEIDLDKILKAAKELGVAMEINSFFDRLDLRDEDIRKAVGLGVKMVINTDAHNKTQLNLMEYGIAQARRGWAEKKDVLNTWPLQKMLDWFNKK
ncbi:DNA polymerase/3'-5' exonuclease PolX [Patescibacteria group bacterium]|nr:DNA polymerase/3'-5' exonuclease PolX [Patescibacteria group bacterium]